MINQARHEACSGAPHVLAPAVCQDCLSDCLTKQSAQPDILINAIDQGILPTADKHPPFRGSMVDYELT
eukprot:10665527-Prorocentrum_lima.AAC.1